MKELKPVIFADTPRSSYHRNNVFMQNQLLKAMQTTLDPNKLRKMVGVRTVAEVYRTLDKMAIRKEYHEALARRNISLDSIIDGIKDIAEKGFKDGDRLKAYQIFLRSLGLDRYDKLEESGKSWEEALMKVMENDEKKLDAQKDVIDGDYEVNAPEPPSSEIERQKTC